MKKKPKLCILGLNPHNAEFSKNSEEKKIILPVIKKLKKNGLRYQVRYLLILFLLMIIKILMLLLECIMIK